MDLSTDSKNLNQLKPSDFWALSLKKYRISKRLRKLLHKSNGGYNYSEFENRIGYSRSYICHVLKMDVNPSDEFIARMEILENQKKGKER